MKNIKFFLAAFIILFNAELFAQAGGTQSIFILGVGARALSLGNAFVALPQDPTAIYWNPGALDYLSRKGFTFFYTNLLEGANYHFVGYVHPTLSTGTFGIGLIRMGIGGVVERDEHNVPGRTLSFSESEFLLSYSKQIPLSLSVGVSLKVERQVFGDFSGNGVGADLGILFRPAWTNPLLRNLSMGLTIQNAISPRLKLIDQTEVIPHNIKFGVAKSVKLGGWGRSITFFLDFDKGDVAPLKFHMGTEYVFQEWAMLRLGSNDGQPTFGAGAAYEGFQLDYSYGKFSENEFSPSHRVSLTIEFGKTKAELIKIAKERQLQEIEERVQQRVAWEQKQRINEGLEQGRGFFAEEDYYRAYREFSKVLGDDPENPEAKEMLEKTNEKIEEQRQKEAAEAAKLEEAERKRLELKQYVDEHFQKALKFLESEDYLEAIKEWDLILERDPQNTSAKEWRARTEAELENDIANLIQKADALAREGNYREAIRKLDEARNLSIGNEQLRKDIQAKIRYYDRQLDFLDLYERGVNYYSRKDYKAAMETFKQILDKVDPGNERVKRLYLEAKARAEAKEQVLTGESKVKFLQGVDLFTEGKYKEALKIWEELLKKHPYNKQLLEAIDRAKESLRKQEQKK